MAQENRLRTIDGETLMSKPLQPLNFVVDTLISQGLHILAGSPKVGKSWLALWLAVTVAKGEPVWGMQVKRGTTLYLCLEDSQIRIQNRLYDVTEDVPASVHFCTESRILGDGLTEQLELQRNTDNVWEVTADSYRQPELLGGRIVLLLSALLDTQPEFIGTPTELANKIDPDASKGITPKKVARQILQSIEAPWKAGIAVSIRRSNEKRLIELCRADSADFSGVGKIDPIDPAGGEDACCAAQ